MILKLKRTPGIYLVGFMASGKTTIGRLLADRLGWQFSDLDEEIEAQQRTTIAEIFDTRGEPEFRRIESAAHPRARALDRARASHGGGPGRRRVRAAGKFRPCSKTTASPIWLDCPFETVRQRVGAALPTGRWRATRSGLRNCIAARQAAYARADYRIPIESDDPSVAVEAMLKLPLFG